MALVAVIGAGLAGVTLARELAAAGLSVRLFDKGRGPGGRMATRRAESFRFDHGAQFVTVRDPVFIAEMDRLVAAGHAACLGGRVVRLKPGGVVEESPGTRYVGVPGMNAILKALAEGLDVGWGTHVAGLRRGADGIALADAAGRDLGRFDAVVAAVPAPQAVPFLEAAPALAAQAAAATMAPCWAVMLALSGPVATPWDSAFVADGGPLGWVSRENRKPGRDAAECWVLHGSPAWSITWLEEPAERVIAELTAAFATLVGDCPTPVHAAAHRWRYAMPTAPLGVGSLWDAGLRLGACGDWCVAPRAESAAVSGRHLAARICADLGADLGAGVGGGVGTVPS